MQLALPGGTLTRLRLRLPPVVPPFSTRGYRLFSILWLAAFALALIGPLAGLYYRYIAPANNSQLLLGSRAGFAVAPADATRVRFLVGPPIAGGVRPGDHIVAIYGLPLPPEMSVTEVALTQHGDDPAYITMGNLLFGSDSAEVPLTVRGTDGALREVTVTTGEQHIDAGARRLGVSPKLLSFIDLLHVLAYPFLLWAAWMLHRRNARDVVSSILSLAMLLTMAAEQPSSLFLANVGISRALNVALYDLGNIFLLAGLLLFPHGNLSWKTVALIAALPIMMFLHGQAYQTYVLTFMIVGMILAVVVLLRSLRQTESTEMRQQIRWALLGISGYVPLRAISIACDMFKWSSGTFGQQMLLEMLAGVALALAVLALQFGLLVALLRYRLYDADVVISRSANIALITLVVAAVFAALADALKQVIYNYYGNTNSEGPVVIAAAIATILVNPIQERIQRWSEHRFQRDLVMLRDELPERVRDMRETASLEELLDEVTSRVEQGVRSVRSAVLIHGEVVECRGVDHEVVEGWRTTCQGSDYEADICDPEDRLFPVRLPLIPAGGDDQPIGFILVGPRPDGSIPSRDEQRALADVSESIARAVRMVMKREERERAVAELIDANSRRIADLETRLASPNSSSLD
ncbi:MAG TPA: hypothetical protein VJP82_08150 [Sphingomicrobium sp.]|jgi:hypothetical protein|nr:hypothetical protein [Sphingomicrobium sp.]